MQLLYESYFKEDATKFEKFKNDTGLLSLDENQFALALERLEDILAIFDVAPEQVKELGILITKLKDDTLTDDEENYFYKLIGNYFKESYTIKRYFSRFRENAPQITEEDPSTENIILMPLVSTFLRNSFMSKISVANQNDFTRIKDQLADKKEDIIKLITDNPNEGISLVNSALIDGIKDSSYINAPTPDILPDKDDAGESIKSLEDSEWFTKYASDSIKQSLSTKVDQSKFSFNLNLPAPESNEEGLEGNGEEITDETPEEAPEIEGIDDIFGGDEEVKSEPAVGGGGGGGGNPQPEDTGEELPPEGEEAPEPEEDAGAIEI